MYGGATRGGRTRGGRTRGGPIRGGLTRAYNVKNTLIATQSVR